MSKFEVIERENKLRINIMYPDISSKNEKNSFVTIGLDHVRAADDIMIYFDGPRNGWVISMDLTRDLGNCSEAVEEKREVAFIPAWNDVSDVNNVNVKKENCIGLSVCGGGCETCPADSKNKKA